MYNFDVSSFPEFNYIKKHMLSDTTALNESGSPIADSFLKNLKVNSDETKRNKSELVTNEPKSTSFLPKQPKQPKQAKKKNKLKLNQLFSKSTSKLENRPTTALNCSEGLKNPQNFPLEGVRSMFVNESSSGFQKQNSTKFEEYSRDRKLPCLAG